MPVPVIARVPEVMAAKLTAPPLVIVRLFVPVFRAVVAVMVPKVLLALLRIVSGSVKV
jgi:hypothetical protein